MRSGGSIPDIAFAVLAIVILMISGSLGLASFEAYKEGHRGQQSALAAAPLSEEIHCVEAARGRARSCVSRTSARNEAEIQNLRAQHEMAEWSYAMVLVTIGGLIITAFGLIYVVRAFRLNAAATEHAARAADAATLANQQSIDVARAHVCILGAEFTAESGMPDTVLLFVKNVGQTLAKNVDIRDHAFFSHPDDNAVPSEELISDGVIDMAPGQETTKHGHTFDEASTALAASQLAAGLKGAFYYMGRIDYVDLAGRPQWTTFRFKATPDNHGIFRGGPMGLCREGNSAS